MIRARSLSLLALSTLLVPVSGCEPETSPPTEDAGERRTHDAADVTRDGGTAPEDGGPAPEDSGPTPIGDAGPRVAGDYEPPLGIPAPPFGVVESHTMYEGATYAAGGFAYRDAGNGPYTHYVDNSDAACTDSDNPYGTAERPRCGLPTTNGRRQALLPPGTVVEIHGGLDEVYDHGGIYQVTAEGTASSPVFIRGFSEDLAMRPRFENTDLRLAGSYFVVENLDVYDDCQLTIHPSHDLGGGDRSDHIAVRYLEIHEPPGDSGDQNGSSATGDYVVYFANHVHDNWRSETQDAHGLYVGQGSTYVWILDNDIHGNSGNGFQACHNCAAAPPEHLYIGRNHFHEDKELAIGLKYANHVVISQNRIHDYTVSGTAQGTGIVVGADGPTNDVWMIFNEIHHAPYAIRIEETETDVYVIGNVIHDIGRAALNLEKRGPNVFFHNNTVRDVGQFINQTWVDQFALHARNNVLVGATGSEDIQIEAAAVAASSTLAHNLFYGAGGPVTIRWGSAPVGYADTAALTGFGGGSGNLIADPEFEVSSAGDLDVASTSATIDGGDSTVEEVLAMYQSRFGVDIRVDFSGVSRPMGSAWDIGAYEH